MNKTNNSSLVFTTNEVPRSDDRFLSIMSEENVYEALSFHRSFPQYKVTPLHKLTELATYLGVDSIYVKDESYRFGLNAFKVLGGSFAIAKYISKKADIDMRDLNYRKFSSAALRKEIGQTTFYTATDGNHGRGIAWSAKRLGQKAVVRMPRGSSPIRKKNIEKENATVSIEDLNYDQCVRLASEQADADKNGVLIQDTSWRGYTDIPSWIMQGYGSLSLEADRQMLADGCERPTHIFVQAGVGALAGSVVGYFANKHRFHQPIMCVVEAGAADCLYRSAMRKDGKIAKVTGKLDTIMAGLSCGEPCTIGWDILRNHAAAFAGAPDWMSAMATRIYGVPLEGDPQIISGESGSITMGFLYTIMMNEEYADIKKALKLDSKSRILLISTEGNTDPVRFREVVWNGLYGIRHRGEGAVK